MAARRIATLVAMGGAGLAAGFFFAYEWPVTLGLAEVDDPTYVKAFQAINETIENPWFAAVFFGTAPAIGAALFLNWSSGNTNRVLIGLAAGLYLAVMAITALGNVPLNDELATYDLVATTVEQARADFENEWNTLNLVRTVLAIGSFLVLGLALALGTADNVRS